MTAIVTVYAVFADQDEAERIGRAMIEAELAACVNILAPCRSLYRWHGKIEQGTETPALFKAAAEQAGALVQAIAKMHSYDLPAIAVWPVAFAGPGYAEWVASAQELGLR